MGFYVAVYACVCVHFYAHCTKLIHTSIMYNEAKNKFDIDVNLLNWTELNWNNMANDKWWWFYLLVVLIRMYNMLQIKEDSLAKILLHSHINSIEYKQQKQRKHTKYLCIYTLKEHGKKGHTHLT